jgi:alpha-galactosidase
MYASKAQCNMTTMKNVELGDVSPQGVKSRKSTIRMTDRFPDGVVCSNASSSWYWQRNPMRCALIIVAIIFLGIIPACRGLSGRPLFQKNAERGIAEVPPLGWRSWNVFKLEIDQQGIQAQIDALKMQGPSGKSLADLGFDSVGVDDGWQACRDKSFNEKTKNFDGIFHDASGIPQLNLSRFPDLHALSHHAHAQGIKLGWYFNNCFCNELGHVDWGGHPAQDVAFLVKYELDEVKVDGCGPAHDIARWSSLIAATGKQILLENCGNNPDHSGIQKPEWPWSPVLPEDLEHGCPFHFYRVSDDIAPNFLSTMWNLQQMLPFLDREKPLSRPRCWAYPDMLQVMNGLDIVESRSHFGAWAITSSPLILSFDLANRDLLDSVWAIIGNEAAINVNQQWAGHPGFLVWSSTETFHTLVFHGAEKERGPTSWFAPVAQVWAKPQPNDAVAVLLLNLSNRQRTVTLELKDVGFVHGAQVMDIWTGSSIGYVKGEYAVALGSHDSMFLLLKAQNPGKA